MPRLVPQDSSDHIFPTDLETRALAAVMGTRSFDSVFMSALRKANQLFGAALLLQVAELKRSPDPFQKGLATTTELELKLAFAHQTIDILLDRLDRMPPSHRPRYRQADRGKILHHKDAFHLSCKEVAWLYALARSTVHRWVVDSIAPKRPDRPLVAPSPPDRSFSELVKQQVRNMAMAGFGGSLRISQTLALEGVRLSRSTVRRWTMESSPTGKPAAPAKLGDGMAPAKASGNSTIRKTSGCSKRVVEKAVRAKRPNHVLMVDVTLIKALMGFLSFRLAVVIDVFSRFPLAFRLFTKEPSASDMESVLGEAVARARRLHPDLPLAHFVTDKGACFTAEALQNAVTRHGMKARFGAVGRHGSIALIERLWLGLKDLLQLRLDRRLLAEDLEPRIAIGLFYYAVLKPHQGLAGSTPAEVYFQKAPARLSAIPPPRVGDQTNEATLAIRYLDPARRVPVLMKKAA